jgi:hypothetical protein
VSNENGWEAAGTLEPTGSKGELTHLLNSGAKYHKPVKEGRFRTEEEQVFHRLFHRVVENGNSTTDS